MIHTQYLHVQIRSEQMLDYFAVDQPIGELVDTSTETKQQRSPTYCRFNMVNEWKEIVSSRKFFHNTGTHKQFKHTYLYP